ncbi:TOMM precursor leader peptide-binding protein [Actinomadura vinacea]
MLLDVDGATPGHVLRDRYGQERIGQLLGALDRNGLLVDEDSARSAESVGPTSHIRVAADSPAVRRFGALLEQAWRGDEPTVMVTDSYLRSPLRRQAASAAGSGRPWILVKLDLESVWISPIFALDQTPCWRCFQRRILSRDDRLALLHAHACPLLTSRSGGGVPVGPGPPEATRVARRIEAQILPWKNDEPQKLLRLRGEGAINTHTVIAYPDCEQCRRPASPRRVRSTDLLAGVESVFGDCVGPVTGLVTDQGTVEVLGPTKVAVANYAMPAPGAAFCQFSLDASGALTAVPGRARYAFGAGESEEDARARALLEAAERYCTLRHGDEPTVRSIRADLDGPAHVPNDLMGFSDDQLEGKGPHSAIEVEPDLRVPRRYRDGDLLDWCAALTLKGEQRWVPAACCYRYPDEHPDTAVCVYDSNGCAVGFSHETAVVAGFLESVERDAVAIWWYGKIPCPIVDLRSFDDPYANRFVASIRSEGHQVTIFDVTCDTRVPVLVALSVPPDREVPLLGFGAHFDVRQALRSALRELAQAVCFQEHERAKWQGFSWRAQTHLTEPTCGTRRLSDYTLLDREPTLSDCQTAADAAGVHVLVRDCTRRDLAIPCVKVIIPGFRGFRPRFAPGRLFDVPARMGWPNPPRSVTDLNTHHLRG